MPHRTLLCLLAIITAFPVHAGDVPMLRAGFGEVDVTPAVDGKPVWLAGFGHNRKATIVHDPIMVRAVVLDDGKTKIALASVDVVGLFRDSVQRVRRQLPGFAYVLVSSTHNHEGPDTMGLWGSNAFVSGVDKEYLKTVEQGIAKAVQDAAAAVVAGDIDARSRAVLGVRRARAADRGTKKCQD